MKVHFDEILYRLRQRMLNGIYMYCAISLSTMRGRREIAE